MNVFLFLGVIICSTNIVITAISCCTNSNSCFVWYVFHVLRKAFHVILKWYFMFFEQHFMFLCNVLHVSKVVFQNMQSAFHVEKYMLKVYHFVFFVHVLVQRSCHAFHVLSMSFDVSLLCRRPSYRWCCCWKRIRKYWSSYPLRRKWLWGTSVSDFGTGVYIGR